MRKRNILLVLLILIPMLFLVGHFFLLSHCDEHFVASYFDKQERLQSADHPKIILVGDSAIAHGVNSLKIQSVFDRDTINWGISSLISFRFMMESTKPYIQDGDIIVISPAIIELSKTPQFGQIQFDGQSRANWLWWLLVLDISQIQFVTSTRQVESLIEATFDSLQNRINPQIKRAYSGCGAAARYSFNEQGDFIPHLSEPSRNRDYSAYDLGQLDVPEYILDAFNTYAQYVYKQGASIYFLPTPMSKTAYDNNRKAFDRLDRTLAEHIDFPILGSIEDFVFSDEYIYDEIFHTTAEGREIYTEKVAEFLTQELNDPSSD